MKINPCTIMFTGLLCLVWLSVSANNGTPSPSYPPNSRWDVDVIKLRLEMMDCPVTPVFDNEVSAYLRSFLTYGYRDTERMLGEGKIYFPIFEHYLEMHGLPKQLKYLPMIESSMKPYAVSYAGAAGLWQFMPSTGTYLGLIVDKYLDERKDPYRSTEAAVRYLKKLHNRFDSWELALAAYNCGPGRLNRTIRAYGSRDYWKIKKGLPRETQKYVSRYIAACYAGTFHRLHGISPKASETFQLQPMAARIYSSISLSSVASMTGLDLSIIKKLNPAFKADYSPKRENGVYLVLPRESWYDYLDARDYKKDTRVARP